MSRLAPNARAAAAAMRAVLGIRRVTTVAGVRYREQTTDSLRRALSRKGSGSKAYTATFPDGTRLPIEATRTRVFADLSGPVGLDRWRPAEQVIRPGMRVLALPGGTGYVADWLARTVGPFGAVASLDRDELSVTYARHRYPSPNIAFERGGVEALTGEPDGSFELVLAVDAIRASDDDRAMVTELCRVVTPGGFLFLSAPAAVPNAPEPAPDEPRRYTVDELVTLARGAVGPIQAPAPPAAEITPTGTPPNPGASVMMLVRKSDRAPTPPETEAT